MKCEKSQAKKYRKRPGPAHPAKKCAAGTVKKGNDGKMYKAKFVKKADGTKYKRWFKIAKASKASAKRKSMKGGAKKKRRAAGKKKQSRWIKHVLAYRKKHKCPLSEAMKKARKTYKPVKK